ncbi:MAG TPA: ABC transporter substrate-binding protein [Microlunatus sp.]|nr:ABC transporter substrate-binding protein [Microlunatus sp.]
MNDTHDHGSSPEMADRGADWRSWSPSRRRFLTLTGLAVGGTVIGVSAAGCGTAQTGSQQGGGQQGRAGASGETLFVAGFQWGPVSNLNPLSASPQWPTANTHSQLIYESLLRFNLLDGSLQPGLGKTVESTDKTTLTVPLQEGTKWQDGSELTADDVVFTFELGKSTSVPFSTVWQYIDSITASDPRTVVFKLKTQPYNPNMVKNYIATVLIVPKAVWSKISPDKIPAETNFKPVGSGPYKLDKFDQTQVNLTRDDNYWGKAVYGTPAPATINHPIFKSNNDGDVKLESGEIDASQQFTAQIWKMWEAGKPVSTWMKKKPYHVPGQIPLLIFNLGKKGLDNVKVRQAIAYAINYPNIATTAMSDYSEPANASLIVPTGYESKYYDAAAVQADGWTYNKDKAIQILEGDLKAKKGSDGIYVLPDGTKLGGWKLITPTGWTDWNTACEIVAKSAQEIGIGISTEFPQFPQMYSSLQNGNFDLAMYNYTGVNPASPWIRFRDAMDDRGVPPVGKTAFWNYNRFSNAKVAEQLDKAAGATNDNDAKAAYAALDQIYRENIPVVPLMYRPLEFYEFNASNWTNFPTEENPYAPPMWQGAGIQWIFKIKKVGS